MKLMFNSATRHSLVALLILTVQDKNAKQQRQVVRQDAQLILTVFASSDWLSWKLSVLLMVVPLSVVVQLI